MVLKSKFLVLGLSLLLITSAMANESIDQQAQAVRADITKGTKLEVEVTYLGDMQFGLLGQTQRITSPIAYSEFHGIAYYMYHGVLRLMNDPIAFDSKFQNVWNQNYVTLFQYSPKSRSRRTIAHFFAKKDLRNVKLKEVAMVEQWAASRSVPGLLGMSVFGVRFKNK